MTPGLAFFYAGMVRPKNVMAIIMQNYVTMGIVSVVWVVASYSIAFGGDNKWWGGFDFVGLGNITRVVPGYTDSLVQSIPPLVFVAFQLMFAIITPALFTGAIADRMKFLPFVILIIAWSLVVYAPVAHWVFSPTGWLFQKGAEDFAGGTVVHANAGAAALALAAVLGKRKGWPKTEMPGHGLPWVLLGAGLLWFGWFGFNAGSALGANGLAGYAFINTNTAAAAALLSWILTERLRGGATGKATSLGAACGLVAGLVAVTPAAGFVNPIGALAIGAIAGIVCCLACGIKYRAKFDDALDVVAVHLLGGVTGALLIGFFGTKTVGGANGLFYGGDASLLGKQALAVVSVVAYSFIVTYVIAKVIDMIFGLRVNEADEETGLDLALHGEVAYDFGSGAGSLGGAASVDAIAENRITTHREERTGHQA